MVAEAVGGAAEEAAPVADHDQVVVVAAGDADDRLGGRPGGEFDRELDPAFGRLLAGEARDRFEELVLVPLRLVYLGHRRRVAGQAALDGDRVHARGEVVGKIECVLERALSLRVAVYGDEDALHAAHG
jgi:hypothetical protein